MKRRKLSISTLKVQSFVTSVNTSDYKGGNYTNLTSPIEVEQTTLPCSDHHCTMPVTLCDRFMTRQIRDCVPPTE